MVLKFKNQEELEKAQNILKENGIETESMNSFKAWLIDEVPMRIDNILNLDEEQKVYYNNLNEYEKDLIIRETVDILNDEGSFIDYDRLDNELEDALREAQQKPLIPV